MSDVTLANVFASKPRVWPKALKTCRLLTCVLQHLVRYLLFSELIVEDCSCSWCIAAVALDKLVSCEAATQCDYIPCCFLTVICDCAIISDQVTIGW